MGPVTTDAEAVITAAAKTRDRYGTPDAPLIAVGDVVTAHLLSAGMTPAVAVVDGQTERRAVDTTVEETVAAGDGRRVEATNPAGTLTESLLRALASAIDDPDPVQIRVNGEEDLAAVPAILAAPTGSTVVYGQPGEGMVHVAVTPEATAATARRFDRFEGEGEGGGERKGEGESEKARVRAILNVTADGSDAA